jgi:hypothetical protein
VLLVKADNDFFVTFHEVTLGLFLVFLGLCGAYFEVKFSVKRIEGWKCPELAQILLACVYILVGGVVGSPEDVKARVKDTERWKENIAKDVGPILCIISWFLAASRLVLMVRLRGLYAREREEGEPRRQSSRSLSTVDGTRAPFDLELLKSSICQI